MKRYLFFLLISPFFTGPVFPSPGPSVAVMVNVSGRGAAACGVREEGLKNIAGFVLNSAKIRRVEPNGVANGLLINTVTSFDSGIRSCHAGVSVELFGFSQSDLQNAPFNGFQSPLRKTVLCSELGVQIAPMGTFPGELSRLTEELIKECLGRLKY